MFLYFYFNIFCKIIQFFYFFIFVHHDQWILHLATISYSSKPDTSNSILGSLSGNKNSSVTRSQYSSYRLIDVIL